MFNVRFTAARKMLLGRIFFACDTGGSQRHVPGQRYNTPVALLVAVVFACSSLGTTQAHAQEQKRR